MQSIFLESVKLSLISSLFAAAVMLVRLIFRKAPKWLFCILWGVVALRLICPVSIESDVSLVPDRLATGQIITNVGNEYIGDVDIIYESNAAYSNAIEAGRQPIHSNDGYYVITEKDSLEAPKTVAETVYPILSWVWVGGMALMITYTAVSFLVLRKKMEEATHLQENVWQCEQAESPFVLGFINPRIYLPYAITDSDMVNVIAHEQAHIQRKDHWWKPIGFLLLSIHWFNPVLWLAYILLCRDIEAACDEKVIKHMEKDEMRAYSTALLHCSVHRRRIAACPLAFGEVGVKERIKRVMNYKKPAFWIIVAAIVACSVAIVCFFTSPSNSPVALPNIHSHAYVVEEVTYENGMYSLSVIAGENSPVYRVAEDMTLASQKEVSETGQWAELGKLEETTLTKENFDDLFRDPGFWATNVNAKDIRRNTVNAWRLVYKQEILYYVLQQKNGDLYLAFGYQAPDPNADPGSFNEHIRWLFKLTMDKTGMSGMVAKSGDSAVPMLSFPKGTMIKDYVDSICWLTINSDDEEFVPFSVWKDGEEQRGVYTAYDAITFEPLKHFIPSGLDPQTYLFQKADPTRGYIVLATFSTEPNAEIYAFGAKFNGYDADNSKLSSLVNEIANNPDCATSSNPFTYIEARKAEYNEILTYGSTAVDFFVEKLRAGENGLQGYIMAVACADITGIGDKDLGADWATAQEWLALYDKEETTHDHTPIEERQADSFIVHAEVYPEITEYAICYQEPDGCITSVAAMGHYEQSFMIHNELIYFVGLSVPEKIYAIDFAGNVQKECVLDAYRGCILYSDENYLYGAADDLGGNYIFQADWNLTECKQIDAFPKQFRQFDYKKVGKDFAELCQADISKIYVHGANVFFDANGMAYQMFLKVTAVNDSATISGNLLLGWQNQHPSYDTVTMNPWFNKVDEGYGSTEGLMTLGDFLTQLKGMEDASVVPDNLPSGTKPFRLTYGTGTPEELPTAEDAGKVYIDLTNGTPNTIADPDTSKDYFSIVSRDDNFIIGTLYILTH